MNDVNKNEAVVLNEFSSPAEITKHLEDKHRAAAKVDFLTTIQNNQSFVSYLAEVVNQQLSDNSKLSITGIEAVITIKIDDEFLTKLKQALSETGCDSEIILRRTLDGFSPIPNTIFLVVCNMFHDSDWVLTTDAMAVAMNWFKNDNNVLTINFFGK